MKRGPVRRFGVGAIASLMALPLVAISQDTANAWNALYCKHGTATVKFFVRDNVAPVTDFVGAADEWEVNTSGISLTKVDVEANRNAYARSKVVDELIGYSGALHDIGDTANGPDCVDGAWRPLKIMVTVNSAYNSNSASRRRGVAVHEFGHLLGLDHNNSVGTCGGTPDYEAIMYQSDNRFNGNCAVFVPQADDRQGINALY